MFPLCERADGDRSLATTTTDRCRLVWMGSGIQLLFVCKTVIVGISRRTVAHGAIVGRGCAVAVGAVVEGIKPVLIFPAIGQTVAVSVEFERVGLGPCLAGVVNAVGVGVAVDEAVEIFVLTESVLQIVSVRIRLGGAGFSPSLTCIDDIVGPLAGQPRLPSGINRLAVAIDPTVSVGIFDAVRNTVVVRVRIGRIGHGAGCLAGSVVGLIQ